MSVADSSRKQRTLISHARLRFAITNFSVLRPPVSLDLILLFGVVEPIVVCVIVVDYFLVALQIVLDHPL